MRSMSVPVWLAPVVLGPALSLAACANDPVYIPGPMSVEAGVDDGMGQLSEGKISLQLPIKLETAKDAEARAAREAELNATRADPLTIPYVKIGDLEVAIEWTITNLAEDDGEGEAKLQLNGANEYFSYDPSIIILSDDDEAPPTPGLEGDEPIHVPAKGRVEGLFKEDQVREASIDLDQITRGNVNPFAATLTISKNAALFQPMTPPMPGVEDYVQEPIGDPIPREAFAQMTRIDLVFKPDRHMALDFAIRVRDVRGIMAEKLMDADEGDLAVFEPMEYAPMPPPVPPPAR